MMAHEMFGRARFPRYLEYSRLIHESGNHLLELINGILDMSKIEAGKFELSEEVFDLAEVAEASVRFLKLPAERSGVAIKTAIAPGAKLIFADKRAVKQILVNLLSNGVKFTPRGGEVRIRAALDARGIEIAVADSGVGISKKDLERLGKPFEQVEGEHVRAKEGTGLGLSLVKALAAIARRRGGARNPPSAKARWCACACLTPPWMRRASAWRRPKRRSCRSAARLRRRVGQSLCGSIITWRNAARPFSTSSALCRGAKYCATGIAGCPLFAANSLTTMARRSAARRLPAVLLPLVSARPMYPHVPMLALLRVQIVSSNCFSAAESSAVASTANEMGADRRHPGGRRTANRQIVA